MATRTIGIIAGSGVYPETFVEAARRKCEGVRLVVAAFVDETRPDLADKVDAFEWFRVGQLSKTIKYFKKQGVNEAIMVGQIAPSNLFSLRPDIRLMVMLAKVKERNAETLFGAIANEMDKDGITLINATTFLEDIMPSAGHVMGPKLKPRQWEDAEFGFRMAKETSRLDIGQSVVVRHGTVLAAEAFEGTNACIKRGGELGKGKDVTLAKVSKPNQDFRFDVPCVGPDTIKNCARSGVGVIAIEADKTLVLDYDEVMRRCQQEKVSLVAISQAAGS
ncbi:LpxI family protein [Persicirhabdus sediminis]|uniref:UDP-2,3-diacylglucosamine diphosphatase LpxI n=1 Tax=Persicirhabdus sediminis TaxID=454144 RepID=A0A8J7MEW2_9BACT|nr:UDP-2,3-diacylglucosamine diphosphatase LpxI [Persicirhabdus sediminis]MBK1791233.1 UDP-2,3-diacylglucosamine diphosphatase LpxI [Persicirhabdus sediminis]